MKALTLTNNQLESIYFEDSERFILTNSKEWEQDVKQQSCAIIFEDMTTGLQYKGYIYRSGSPFSYWTYDSEMYEEKYTLNPIEEVEIVVKKFKEISNDKITETEVVKEI